MDNSEKTKKTKTVIGNFSFKVLSGDHGYSLLICLVSILLFANNN